MKKIVAFASILLVGVGLTACNSEKENSSANSSAVSSSSVVEETGYTATVFYPDNTPAEGVSVQWCAQDGMCFLPVKTNSEGKASIQLDDGKYYVHIDNIPQGYTYNPNAYAPTASNKHIDVKLLTLNTASSGTGTQTDSYQITTGVYRIEYTKDQEIGSKSALYYDVTLEAGTYEIETMAIDALAVNEVTLAFGNFGLNGESNVDYVNDGKVNIQYELNVTEAGSYKIAFLIMSASNGLPYSFDFSITRK